MGHALAQIGRACERDVTLEIFHAKPDLVGTSVNTLYTAYSEMMSLETRANTAD